MAAKETPLAAVKRQYGSKDKLVEAVVKGLGEDDDTLAERLKVAPNSKLLRLAQVTKVVSETYGGRAALVDKLCAAQGKAKDGDYKAKLERTPLPRLLDMVRAAERRARRAS